LGQQRSLVSSLALAIVGGIGPATGPDWETIGRQWWSHVSVLADDRMEGRETGSQGFEKAAAYVADQFRAAGLKPAGVEGYRQPVDFSVTQIVPARCSFDLVRDGEVRPVALGDDAAIIGTSQSVENVDAEAAFVGYGLTVPEMKYDDLAGQDLSGKIAVYVQGGPADMPGAIKAHYGSPYERVKSLRKAGAFGLAFIPNPKVPERPFPLMAATLLQPFMELRDAGPEVPPALPVILGFNPERAEMLFAGSSHTFQEVVARLGQDGPLPCFPLAVKVRGRVGLTRWEAKCQNVAGVLPGSDFALKDEYVVVSAHLDHLGVGTQVKGAPIYRGAMDNASGVASLIEIARWLNDSGTKPKRSILFLAVTGEEKFLLGSEYFARHPTVPGRLVANLNLDCHLPLFPLKYLEIQGLEESSLGEDIRTVGGQSGVEVHPAYEPDRVLFIRSDQYSFIKVGVPALVCSFGFVRGSAEEKLYKAWFTERYHSPEDDLDQPVDLVAAAQFNSLFEKLVMRVADAERPPTWNHDSFFNRFVR
jgi:Peptidase family M28